MKFERRMDLEQACLIFLFILFFILLSLFFFFFDDLYVSICFAFMPFNLTVLRAVCFCLRLS